jgi:hypothetical protein
MILFLLSCVIDLKDSLTDTNFLESTWVCPSNHLIAVEAGEYLQCAIDETGCIGCWASPDADRYPKAIPMPSLSGIFKQVAFGNSSDDANPYEDTGYGCVLKQDGQVQCWGTSAANIHAVPSEQFAAIDMGRNLPCGLLEDGTLQCWGSNVNPVTTEQYRQLSVGWDSGCAITLTGDLNCWVLIGEGNYREMLRVSGPFTSVNADYGVCAMHTERGLLCWYPYFGENEELPDFEEPEVQAIDSCSNGDSAGCWLNLEGIVTCRTLQPMFEVPLISLSCSFGAENVLCGLTADGEGRCWEPSRGMWALP